MQLGLGIGINTLQRRGEVSPITATVTPALDALSDGDTIASAMSGGYDQASNYSSTAGTISTVVAAATVNGVSAAFGDTVAAGDVVVVTVTVTDSAANERAFNAGTQTVAATVPDAFGVADWGISVESALDPDASAYIAAVETADGQALEEGVKTAINDFVVGCKADAIWTAIKASCILAGARTLNGALVPLAGTAPTSVNFVSADYNRKTGLKGDGSTKHLDSNRANNADPQDSNHNAVMTSIISKDAAFFVGADETNKTGVNALIAGSNQSLAVHCRSSGAVGVSNQGGVTSGFKGFSRSVSSEVIIRASNGNSAHTSTSQAPTSTNMHIFSRDGGVAPTDARLSFYSIGESIDLAALDARVAALMTALDGAIA